MKIKNISFKYKILGLALIIITLLTLSIIFTITNTFHDILEDIIFQSETKNIKQNSEMVTSWFAERKHDLKIYANTEVMQNGSWQEKKNYLLLFHLKNPQLKFFLYFEEDYHVT